MFSGVHHVAFVVQDLDQSIKLFQETFGLTLERRFVTEDSGWEVAIFETGPGATFVELMRPKGEAMPFHPIELHHVAFGIADFDNALNKLAANGVKIRPRQPLVLDNRGWRLVFGDVESPFSQRFQFVDADYRPK